MAQSAPIRQAPNRHFFRARARPERPPLRDEQPDMPPLRSFDRSSIRHSLEFAVRRSAFAVRHSEFGIRHFGIATRHDLQPTPTVRHSFSKPFTRPTTPGFAADLSGGAGCGAASAVPGSGTVARKNRGQ